MRGCFAWMVGVVLIGSWVPRAEATPVAQRELDLVLGRTPDAGNGEKLFETCAACHGEQGQGAPDGTVPRIAGQPFTIVAKQLVDFRAGVRGDARMQHFTDTRHLAYSQHIADVAAYIAQLPVTQLPMTKGAFPEGEGARSGAGASGAMIYARNCEKCHGATASGNEETLTPRLASQYPVYLMKQLDDASAGRREPMARTHGPLVKQLSADDLRAVTTYLAGL